MKYPSPFLMFALLAIWFLAEGDPSAIDAAAARLAGVDLAEYVALRSER